MQQAITSARAGTGAPRTGTQTRALGASPALLLTGAVIALALPSAVLAFTSGFETQPPAATETAAELAVLQPSRNAPALGRRMTVPGLTRGQLFRFTPAGNTTRPDRSVTVAVRVDPVSAGAITVRAPNPGLLFTPGLGKLRIAPTAYSLGVSRGFQNFLIPGELHRFDTPDLAAFKLGPKTAPPDEPSRLAARLALDAREKTGRAPRTLEASGEQVVDFGGSFRLTRNLDVTAGVRYSQDRDRLVTVVPDGQKDAQAVYVGTQIKF